MNTLINGDCLKVLEGLGRYDCIFADPPDNIGLGYDEYKDRKKDAEYEELMFNWIKDFIRHSDIVWLSFNSRWSHTVGWSVRELQKHLDFECKPCVQVFTFGQHNKNDLGNNHRPLWRFMKPGATLYPDAIKVPSWRERNGDKRAKPGGRVPGDVFDMAYNDEKLVQALLGAPIQPGDVFDFPRVTGNSKQRCDWHPTQLHEELVERCLKLSTKPGGTVLDPFGGTGTTLRVCEQIGRTCTLIELDAGYCKEIKKRHKVKFVP